VVGISGGGVVVIIGGNVVVVVVVVPGRKNRGSRRNHRQHSHQQLHPAGPGIGTMLNVPAPGPAYLYVVVA